MFFKKNHTYIKEIIDIDVAKIPWCNNAKLIYIKGMGKFEYETKEVICPANMVDYISSFKLNGTPLMYQEGAWCPTCANLLATGYGIDNANCDELKAISDAINSDFISLEDSIKKIEPILNLLKTGLYIIADTLAFPTDGDEHFFWNIPNELTSFLATTYACTDDYEYVQGNPVYLYPSQKTDRFDNERVEYYIKKYKNPDCAPRAIAYNHSEFISLLLDGHHKACAAALTKNEVKCLTIIPCSAVTTKNVNNQLVNDKLHFSSIKVDCKLVPKEYHADFSRKKTYKKVKKLPATNNLITKKIPTIYLESSRYYPTLSEYANMIICEDIDFNDNAIFGYFDDLNSKNIKKIRVILNTLFRKNDLRFKKIALLCTKANIPEELRFTAFSLLHKIKDDQDIEQIFIDCLVNDEDVHSKFRILADSYWN